MSPRLPILAFLWLLASSGVLPEATAQVESAPARDQAKTAAAQMPPQAGDRAPETRAQAILPRAISAMEGRQSVFAKSSHHINLYGKPQLLGTAQYIEQQSEKGRLLRMDLKIMLGNQQISTLVEAFDGDRLSRYEDLGGKTLTQVDVNKADRILEARGKLPKNGSLRSLPGLWGLAKLLRGLDADFAFTLVEETALTMADQSGRGRLPVWKLQGAWRPEKLAKILPDQAEDIRRGQAANLDKLPEHLPDRVILCLGKDDLFPYQIDYRRNAPKRFWSRDRSESRSILTMKFTEVDFNRPFEESKFEYPGRQTLEGVKPIDGTEAFAKKLELDRE